MLHYRAYLIMWRYSDDMSSPTSPSQNPISLTPQGPPTTVIPLEDPAIRHELSQALAVVPEFRREAVATVVSHHPRSLISWANIGDLGRDNLERYAYYRIGYHRGLDTLRQNGWRGSGYVRWNQESNHGFLRCLLGLQKLAEAIGEADEAERCHLFLLQLDPSGIPPEFLSIHQ